MKAQMMKFWKDEDGATAIEYGLIAGLIAVAIVGTLGLLGTDLSNVFSSISSSVKEAVPAAGN